MESVVAGARCCWGYWFADWFTAVWFSVSLPEVKVWCRSLQGNFFYIYLCVSRALWLILTVLLNVLILLNYVVELTIIMPSCMVSLQKSPDGYRWCSTPPLVLSSALASMTTSPRLFATFSTGCQYLSRLSSRSLFSCSTVSVVLALATSKISASRCRILLLGALSVRLSVVTCLFLEQKCRSSVEEFHGGCSGRLEFTTGSLMITTDKSRTVSGWV